jgi:hypothetical protein
VHLRKVQLQREAQQAQVQQLALLAQPDRALLAQQRQVVFLQPQLSVVWLLLVPASPLQHPVAAAVLALPALANLVYF